MNLISFFSHFLACFGPKTNLNFAGIVISYNVIVCLFLNDPIKNSSTNIKYFQS